TFRDDEWSHKLHAYWLRGESRFDEAYVAYSEALRRDPEDANTLHAMATCRWFAGDLRGAERHLLEALGTEPHNAAAADTLAAVYLRELDAIASERGDDDAGFPPL